MADESKNTDISFFTRILNLFTPNDPEIEKKRMLKAIAKELGKSKFKFYKYSGDEALPTMGKFFFELYKIVGPAQSMFQSTQNPAVYRNMVIDYSLTDNQKNLAEKLMEESILEKAKKVPIQQLSEEIKNDLANYVAEFDSEKITKIDNLYNKLISFIHFCNFDFYFILKKFDSSIREKDFTYIPRFENIRAEYVLDDLKDFSTVAWALPLEEDWSDIHKMLKTYKGIDPIASNVWSKVLQRLKVLRNQNIFEMMIQLISKDPMYKTNPDISKERIIEPQLEKMKSTIETTLKKIEVERKNNKVDELLNQIFGSTVIVRLKNYTESTNQSFERYNIGGYQFYQPLNYLKAFLLDYFKKYVREFSDLVLIRGKWVSANLASPMSEAYHQLLEISDRITEFDDTLGEDGEIGQKIKMYVSRSSRDMEAKKITKTILREANEKAASLLTDATQNLVIFAKHTKALIEDHDKKNHEMLINWPEIQHFCDRPFKEQGIEIYKKIYLFVTLMQFFLSKKEE
jgi:hypothetical protein